MERKTFVQTIYPWKSTQIWSKDIQASGYYNGNTWNLMVYTGKQDPPAGLGHAQTVVMNLIDGLLGFYRTVVANKFFTSIYPAKSLLRNGAYLIGTLRSNRAGSEHAVVQKELRCGEVHGLQSKNGMKLIKWKDKRDVLMISTKLSHSITPVETGRTNKLKERTMKTQVIGSYNRGKHGVDLSDQLSTYYTCLRRSKNWYRNVAFEMIFGMSIVNAYLIYKENYNTSRLTMLQFRESLMWSLLLGVPYENLKPGPRESSTGRTKRELADHKLEEMEKPARGVRRRCVSCYEKIRQQ